MKLIIMLLVPFVVHATYDVEGNDKHWPKECKPEEYTDYCLEKWEASFCAANPNDANCLKYFNGGNE